MGRLQTQIVGGPTGLSGLRNIQEVQGLGENQWETKILNRWA